MKNRSPLTRPVRLATWAVAALALPGTVAPAHADEAPTRSLDEIIVTAPAVVEPLVVTTDPKNPRLPAPAADGGGYLKSIPGFSLVRKGGSSGDPVFRGQGGSRLNILLDGTPLLGGCNSRMDPPTAYIFPESYDEIRVIKGPQSVAHGSGTVGATVMMERKYDRFKEPGVRGTGSLLFGSYGRNDQMLDVTGGGPMGFARAIGTHSQADDYKDGSGKKVHSEYDRTSGLVSLGWTPDDRSRVQFTADISEAEAAYADRAMDGVVFDRRDFKLEATRDDISPLIANLKGQVYHNYIDHVMDRFSLRTWTGGGMSALSNPDRTNVGGKLSADLAPAGDVMLKVGVDFNRDVHSSRSLTAAEYTAGVSYKSKTRTEDLSFDTYGGFVEAEYALSAEDRIKGGYRLNRTKTADASATAPNRDTDILHNVFARYEQDMALRKNVPVTVYAGLGHTQRAPDYWERTKTFEVDSEKDTQIDIGAMHRSEDWRWSVSGFYMWGSNYILSSSSAAKNVSARMTGGEAEVSYGFLPSWSVEGTAAYVRGTNKTDGTALAQMPPLDTSIAVKYDDGAVTGSVLLRAVADQDRVDIGWGTVASTDVGPTGGFTVLSASLGWRPWDGSLLAFGVDNILDKTYAEHISRSGTSTLAASGFEQTERVNEPGRTFWIKANMRF